MTTPTFLSVCSNILLSPNLAWQQLREKSLIVPALLLQIVLTSVAIYLFYSGMSAEWLVEQQLLQAGDLTPAETEQARAMMAQTAAYTPIIGVVSVVVVSLLMHAIFAGYYHLIGKMAGNFSYSQWFAASVWSQMPLLLNMIGLMLLTLMADNPNLPLSTANYASVNQLLLQLPPSHGYFFLTESLNLFYFWQVALLTLAFRQWCQFSLTKALLLAAFPLVLIFGIWALLI
jgi:magnesium-transporting ATPase (P-type)